MDDFGNNGNRYGGLFAWISYIAPLMTEVGGFDADKVPYILVLAGFGMVVGNIFGGKLADKISPIKACLILLLLMASTLMLIFFTAESKTMALITTFIAGSLSLAVGAPIQILMIKTAKEAEMLGAAATQAAFNIGNALGAFLGGVPIAMGYGFTSPELIGTVMAIIGAGIAFSFMRNQQAHTVMPKKFNRQF